MFAVLNKILREQPCPDNVSNFPHFSNDAVRRLLLDGDHASCLQPFSDGNRFQRLIAYVYIPPYNPSHGLIINVSGTDLTCGDPALLVYYEDGAVDTQTLMQQCRYRKNGDSSVEGVTTSCSFLCAGKYPLERLTVIFWQVETMPWEPHTIPQYRICEINSEIYIPDI